MTSKASEPSNFDKAVAVVADVLRTTGAVPMPGGHGAFFSTVHRRHPRLFAEPGTVARCYVCLTLLGRPEADEKWNRTEWLPHATAWFDTWCPEVAATLEKPRWEYLLAAMMRVVEEWIAESRSRKLRLSDLTDCYKLAINRLNQLYARTGSKMLAMPIVVPAGVSLEQFDPKWKAVEILMTGENAARVEMLYFMNVFHSSLGVASHSVDKKYAQRRDFYGQMLKILRGFSGTCALCEARERIAGALETTGVMSGPNDIPVHVELLMHQLPTCFHPTTIMSRPPIRRNVARRLNDPIVIENLLAVHDLAEAMADRMMDFVWAGGPHAAVFRPQDYGYALSMVRDGQRRYREQLGRNALPPDEAGLSDEWAIAVRPMSQSFAERMTLATNLIEPSRERLTHLSPEIRWTDKTNDHCAACQSAASGKDL